MKKVYLLLFSCVVFASSLCAQPSLPLYEPFSSTVLGTLAPQNGWTGPTGAGLGAQVVDTTLSYTGLSTMSASYGVRVGNQPSGGLQTLPFAAQTTKVYASFLIRLSTLPIAPSAATATYVALGNGSTSAACMYAFPNADGTTFELGFSAAPNQTTGSNNKTNRLFTVGQTIMIVLAYTPATSGSNGTLDVWINPSEESLAPGGTPPAPNFPNRTGGTATSINTVHLRSGATVRPMIFDELRVGTSWSEVTTNTIILPVTLTDLKLTTKGNSSLISWTSQTEINFKKYVVLYSHNGRDFREVGSVDAKGSHSKYSFAYSHTREAFFKLKLVDEDGSFTYSKVLVANTRNLSIKIGPNPVTDRLYIAGMPEGTNTAVLYNMSGSSVMTQTVRAGNITLPMTALPAGSYILKITNNGRVLQSEIIRK